MKPTPRLSTLARLAVMATFLSPAAASAQERARDEKSIREVLAVGEAAFNAHDAGAYSLTFHPAADLTNPIGHDFHGRDRVEAFYRMMFSGYDPKKGTPSLKAAKVQGGEISIRFLRPDVACVELRHTMTGFIGPDGKDWGVRKGVLALVMTREGGTWAIMTAHIMDLTSPPPVAPPVAPAVPPRP